MKKYTYISSIIVVTVLIGILFTSVVGHRSIESDVKASPLFNIRSSRAIDEERKDFRREYIGKGIPTLITIPTRDSIIVLIRKILDGISKMDEETSNRFVNFLINRHGKMIKEENIPIILNVLHHLKINPDEIKIHNINKIDNELYTEEGFCETVGFIWVPGCIIAFIIGNLIWLILSFVTILWDCL